MTFHLKTPPGMTEPGAVNCALEFAATRLTPSFGSKSCPSVFRHHLAVLMFKPNNKTVLYLFLRAPQHNSASIMNQ